MSKNTNQNNSREYRADGARRFCAVFFALAVSAVICGCAISFRYHGDGWDTSSQSSGTPLLTLKPPKTTSAEVRDPETIAPPETSVNVPPDTLPPETSAPPVTAPPVTKPPVTQPPVTKPPVTNPPVTQPPVTEPPVTKPPVTEPPVTNPPVSDTTVPVGDDDPARLTARPLDTEDLPDPPEVSVRVEESKAVESSYFSDALFLGDSRTVGLSLYSGLKSNYYSQQGLNISSVVTSAFISSGDKKITLSQALDEKNSFTKVYISFGINEIGWPSTDSFIKAYTTLVELLQEKLPDAHIYVQEILPMAKATAENSRYKPMGGNGKVKEYNERLYKLCEEKGLHYIALTEIFADENGDLTVTDSFDGIHLGVKSSKAWIEYLKNHTVP